MNYLEPHRFIIKVNDYCIGLLYYDNLNLYLFDRVTSITVVRLKDLIHYLKVRKLDYEKEVRHR